MTIEAAKQAFKAEVKVVSDAQLKKLQQGMMTHHEELIKQFIDCFKAYCQKVVDMQKLGVKQRLSTLQFSLMRSKLIQGVYEFRIDAYDKDGYLDQTVCTGVYDVTCIFSYLENFSKELTERRRKYMQKVTVCRVKQYVLEESEHYKRAVIELIRSALRQGVKLSEYEQVLREDVFVITVGEFRDVNELVYREDHTEKDVEKVKKRLATYRENGHQYEIVDHLELSKVQFEDVRWLYCSGQASWWKHSRIAHSVLLGCQFENAVFDAVDFSNTNLMDVDFTGATLTNVDFAGARLYQVNFENATLKNIDFTKAEQFLGVNLEHATLIDVMVPGVQEVE